MKIHLKLHMLGVELTTLLLILIILLFLLNYLFLNLNNLIYLIVSFRIFWINLFMDLAGPLTLFLAVHHRVDFLEFYIMPFLHSHSLFPQILYYMIYLLLLLLLFDLLLLLLLFDDKAGIEALLFGFTI